MGMRVQDPGCRSDETAQASGPYARSNKVVPRAVPSL